MQQSNDPSHLNMGAQEPPCWDYIGNNPCNGLIGCYTPQCAANGNYEPTQFNPSTGYSWCVDENGTQIGAASPPGNIPECSSLLIPPLQQLDGDVNFDNSVNVLDIIEMVNFILQVNQPSYSEFAAADMNEDTAINITDILLVVNTILQSEPVLDDACYVEPEAGPCLAAIPMHYFNQDTEQCEIFIYGGCEGVVPFEALIECQDTCEGDIY